MLTDEEAAWLLGQLGGIFALYGKPVPAPELLNILADDIEAFGIPVIKKALKRLRVTYDGRSAITSALLIQACESVAGRLSPDEAWAVALRARDESATIVWTDEIERAWWAAAELLKGARGDLVGARRVFLDAYARACGDARDLGRLPAVCVSIGTDPSCRAVALDVARRQGLGVEQLQGTAVGQLLGLPDAESLRLQSEIRRGPVLPPSEVRMRLQQLRESLRELPERQEASRLTRWQASQQELARSKAETAAKAQQYARAAGQSDAGPLPATRAKKSKDEAAANAFTEAQAQTRPQAGE